MLFEVLSQSLSYLILLITLKVHRVAGYYPKATNETKDNKVGIRAEVNPSFPVCGPVFFSYRKAPLSRRS
jgi:hypothetical protein